VDPGAAIREPRVEKSASVIAAIPEVRDWLVGKQRELVSHGNMVVEGRDIGTIVFPDASMKFYLDADPQIRAQRRLTDQVQLGTPVEVKAVTEAMSERDRRDRTRAVAPLKVAEDAIRIDTTHNSVEETTDMVLKHIRSRHLVSG